MLVVTHYEIQIEHLPQALQGLRAVLLADLHGHYFGPHNCDLLRAVLQEKPDFVVAAGDMLEDAHEHGAAFLELLKGLVGHFPVYCIRGNHEQHLTTLPDEYPVLRAYERSLRRIGATVLNDTSVRYTKAGKSIHLYGAALSMASYHPWAARNPERCLSVHGLNRHLGICDQTHPSILLIHTPIFFPTYADWGADVVLAGHMHGGLIRLPKLRGLLSPYRQFFPKYDAGLFTKGKSTLVLSRGLGDSKMRFRLNNPPEVVTLVFSSREG